MRSPEERDAFCAGWTILSIINWVSPPRSGPIPGYAHRPRRLPAPPAGGDTHTQADIHELDTGYLAACRSCALQAAQLLNWRVVRCVDEEGRLRSIQSIHEGDLVPGESPSVTPPRPGSHQSNAFKEVFPMVYVLLAPGF